MTDEKEPPRKRLTRAEYLLNEFEQIWYENRDNLDFAEPKPARTDSQQRLELSAASIYVRGYPIDVSVTLYVKEVTDDFLRPPFPTTEHRIVDADTGELVTRILPSSYLVAETIFELGNPWIAPPRWVRPGRPVRARFWIASNKVRTLPLGRYKITVRYWSSGWRDFGERVASNTVLIRLREPKPEELIAGPDVRGAELYRHTRKYWLSWPLRGPPMGAEHPGLARIGLTDPRRYALVMRYLYRGPQELADIDPALLDVLDAPYEVERDRIRAEIHAARAGIPATGMHPIRLEREWAQSSGLEL